MRATARQATHAQLIGKRTWRCTEESVYRVHSSGPVDQEELEALSEWVTDQAGVHTRADLDHCLQRMRERLEELAAPPPPRVPTMAYRRPKRCQN